MRIPLIAGNWKMHKTVSEARALARAIRFGISGSEQCQVALAPPCTALASVAAIGPAPRHKFFTVEMHHTIAALA